MPCSRSSSESLLRPVVFTNTRRAQDTALSALCNDQPPPAPAILLLTPNDLRLLILLVFTHVVVEVEGRAVFSGQSANVRHVDVADKSTIIFLLQAERPSHTLAMVSNARGSSENDTRTEDSGEG